MNNLSSNLHLFYWGYLALLLKHNQECEDFLSKVFDSNVFFNLKTMRPCNFVLRLSNIITHHLVILPLDCSRYFKWKPFQLLFVTFILQQDQSEIDYHYYLVSLGVQCEKHICEMYQMIIFVKFDVGIAFSLHPIEAHDPIISVCE